ncbi:MAG: family 10 glycosylhydrolase [Acidobacteria bacterium]|nr:family 10 glycosylhydrolase [Acidobacteriota bacterium]
MKHLKRILIAFSIVTIVLLLALIPLQQIAAPAPLFENMAAAPVNEVRALWVVRETMTSPEAVEKLVKQANANGFNTLIVQVRGRGDAYYNARWEPRATLLETQPDDFDPLALTIKEAHAAGIKVHAWINTYLVADAATLPKSPNHAMYKHPEWLAVPRGIANELYRGDPKAPNYRDTLVSYAQNNKEELEGIFFSPAHPGVKEQIYNLWIDITERYDIDGLHFDYIRYPNRQFDYSRTSLDRFRAELEKTMPAEDRKRMAEAATNDALAYVNAYPDRYSQFQRDQVTDLVERVYQGVKARKPDAIVSAAVFANDKDAFEARCQDWKLWLKRGILDAVCPMAYTEETDTFTRQIEVAVGARGNNQVWAGIGSWKIPVVSTLEKISAAREKGAQGFILFSYDAAVRPSDVNPNSDYLNRVHEALEAK